MDFSNKVGGVANQNNSEQNDAALEMQAAMVAEQVANPVEPPKENIMAETAVKKSGKGALIAAVLFAILAVGGIGFGVWTMMDANSQKEALNKKITALNSSNDSLMDQIEELNKRIEELEAQTTNNDAGIVDNNDGSIDDVATDDVVVEEETVEEPSTNNAAIEVPEE